MFSKGNWLSAMECRRRIWDGATPTSPEIDRDTVTLDDLRKQNLKEFFRFCESVDSAGALLPNGEVVEVDSYLLQHTKSDDSGHNLFDHETGILVDRLRGGTNYNKFNIAAHKSLPRWLRRSSLPIQRLVVSLLATFPIVPVVLLLSSQQTIGLSSREAAWLILFVSSLPFSVFTYLLVRTLGHYFHLKGLPSVLGAFGGSALVFREADLRQYLERDQSDRNEPTTIASTARRIVEACERGAPPTKATAKEKFGAELSVRAFDLAWRRAAEQFPELSRPGRRSGH